MGGFFSALSRAIWTFIILSAAAVLVVAATDDARLWPLLSVAGFVGIGVASLVIGWLIRSRRTKEPQDRPAARKSRSRAKAARREKAASADRREPRLGGAAASEDPVPRLKAPNAKRPEPIAPISPHLGPMPEAALEPETPELPAEPATAATGDLDLPEAEHALSQPQESTLRVPPPSGNPEVDRCFDVDTLTDQADHRRWQDNPRLVEARRLRLSEEHDAAVARMGEIRDQFPDYDELYLWTAEALDRAGRPEDRDLALHEGLGAAKSKPAILAALGTYAADDGRMGDAVTWLVRSVAVQLGGGAQNAPIAFLDLAALSEPHKRLNGARAWLYEQADRLDARGTRLRDDFLERRRALSTDHAEEWMLDVIERLWEFHDGDGSVTELPSPRPTSQSSPLRAERRRHPRALR